MKLLARVTVEGISSPSSFLLIVFQESSLFENNDFATLALDTSAVILLIQPSYAGELSTQQTKGSMSCCLRTTGNAGNMGSRLMSNIITSSSRSL